MKKSTYFIIIALVAITLLSGCAMQDFSEVKAEENVGDTITIRGMVEETIKIGDFSGYILSDDSGETLRVSSESLPSEGETITVRGTLMQDTIFGYYLKKN